jgi:hypothetical protein
MWSSSCTADGNINHRAHSDADGNINHRVHSDADGNTKCGYKHSRA